MLSDWKKVLSLALAVAAVGCAQPESEQAPAAAEPAAEQVQDATVVDPVHYKVEFENERMRVVRITYGPGEASVMHHHPDHVTVMLTPLTAEFTLPDGSTQPVEVAAGDHLWVAAGAHQPRSTSDQPFEAVSIEIKAGAAGGEAANEGDADPTVVDAAHYKVEFENERVRVVRITYGPGEASVMHHHPDHVAVMLSDGHFAFEAADGSSQEMQFAAGEHIFAPAGNHRPKNLTEATMKAVLVELK